MSTLEHALIMLLLTGLLSARPRLSLTAQVAIVGALTLAFVVPRIMQSRPASAQYSAGQIHVFVAANSIRPNGAAIMLLTKI